MAAIQAPGRRSALLRRGVLLVVLMLPVAIVNAVGFAAPVANLISFSFREVQASGAMLGGSSLASWINVATDPFYIELLVNTVKVSLGITLLTLVCSYPIALYVHRSSGRWRTFLMMLCVTPLLTSAVVRTYGWIVLLLDDGVVNSMLLAAGLPGPFRLVYNMTGVVIGLVEILMPYMVLSLLAGFGRLDRLVEEAATSLGARPWQSFLWIVMPLSLPGVALGSLLCFVLAVSSFITPKLLGGGRVFLLATEIYDQAMVTLNWPLASSLSIMILLIFGAALFAYSRAVRMIGS
jgi:putative spermidine/putrescine transport system permease protein